MNALDGLPSHPASRCKVGAKYVTKFCSAGLNVIGSSIFAWLNTFVWHNKSETFFVVLVKPLIFPYQVRPAERMKRSALFRQFDAFDVW